MFVTNKAFQKWINDFVGTKNDSELANEYWSTCFYGSQKTLRDEIRSLNESRDKMESKIEKLEKFLGIEYKVVPEKEGYFVKKTKKSK